MFDSKAIVIGVSGFAVALSAFSDGVGLPPKTNPRGDQIDCGAKTDTKLDRTLEKTGPELALGDEKSADGKVTVGLTGSTASAGAKITDENLANLIIGKTTYQEVVGMFGKPMATVRNDHIFVITYSFLMAESKLDPRSFIPIFGSLIAKNNFKTNQRQAQIRFEPETGVLISCTKTDNSTNVQGESVLDSIKRLRIE